ncbi:hypothetical protein MUCCIDRAFT_108221 [Mucor lusitanicus CBS 277.49]|uniref:Uncharacterized protein n=1 Tax=Mucor lusitanicus CBS 277.49 TaxID=747725 RepID=A0A162RDT7_MUCCL|nr:hypothetical protein MUCCIDRAFT_108221 [Mucor lusitanicus CBS 277.49]
MKFTTAFVALVALSASAVMADPTNSTVSNNENPNAAHSASNKVNAGVMAVALTSAVTAAYALM